MGSDDVESPDGVDSSDGEGVSRRTFLQGMGIAMTCPLWSACEFADVFEDEVIAEVEFSLADPLYSDLEEVGATACLEAGAQEVLLIRIDDDNILATERRCPHQNLNMGTCGGNNRPAQWDEENQQLICLHHLSVFDLDGEVVDGPSPRALRIFDVDFDANTGEGIVYITGRSDNGATG